MKKVILFIFLVLGSIIYAGNLSVNEDVLNVETSKKELMHGCHGKNGVNKCKNLPKCPLCRYPGNRLSGHCKHSGRVRNCSRRSTTIIA